MKKIREQKGITLIALIITIVVLLILAVVTINAIKNDDIIGYAKKAADDYQEKQGEENTVLSGYETLIEESIKEKYIVDKNVQGKVLSTTQSTEVWDKYGNKIVVPAGFKITTDANSVPEGIVIEDCTDAATKGSQFVWVPVGKVIKQDNTEVEIELNRYTFASDGTPVPQGDALINGLYQELETSTYGNATAKNLNEFLSSAKNNSGYYIGRYEAGEENDKLVCKANQSIYFIWDSNPMLMTDQTQASSLSQAMYESNEQTNAISDLINSYSWDTAIVFIQKCSTEQDAYKYSMLNKSTTFTVTGANGDEYCNINDLSGNALEWSTEAGPFEWVDLDTSIGKSCRGGVNLMYDNNYAYGHSSSRFTGSSMQGISPLYNEVTFRPILYL